MQAARLLARRHRQLAALRRRHPDQHRPAGLAAWSLVHGFAMLWLNEAIDTDADAVATMQRMAQMLFTK